MTGQPFVILIEICTTLCVDVMTNAPVNAKITFLKLTKNLTVFESDYLQVVH